MQHLHIVFIQKNDLYKFLLVHGKCTCMVFFYHNKQSALHLASFTEFTHTCTLTVTELPCEALTCSWKSNLSFSIGLTFGQKDRTAHGMNPSYCSLIQVLFITFPLMFLIKIPKLKLISSGRIKCQHSEQIASMLNKEVKGNFSGISAILLYFERGNIPGTKHLFFLDGILDSLL